MFIRQPSAGSPEFQIQVLHHQVDWSATCPAHKASVCILAHLKREAGVVVSMERAQSLMMHNPQSKSLCDSLYGEFAELLKFVFIHNSDFFLTTN
jgi:hypothetical protein